MIIAQLSDAHVAPRGELTFGRIDTGACLARAVAHINTMIPRPDVVAFTGDLIDDGSEAAYEHVSDLLEPLAMPVYLLPGNHDDRDMMRRVFAGHPYLPRGGAGEGAGGGAGDFLNYVIDEHPLRLIALDTLIPGAPGGELSAETLSWLAARLGEAPARATVILMHHPPFLSGIGHMDGMNCANGDRLGEIVARHPRIEGILCGHLHRPVYLRWRGTVVSTAPSPGFQVALNLDDESRAEWILEPPALQVHVWRPATGLVSHISFIGDYGGPELFPHA